MLWLMMQTSGASGSVARVESATLQQRLAHVPGNSRATGTREYAVYTPRGSGAGALSTLKSINVHERVHRRRRNDSGRFDARQCLQLRERSFERVLFRRCRGEESIRNGDVEGEAIFRFEAPRLLDQLPKILRCGHARG